MAVSGAGQVLDNEPRFALVEAGGTKFVLGVADAAGTMLAGERVPTTTPDETIGTALAWFQARAGRYAAAGLASFGPLDLDRASPRWGHIGRTPKPHWGGTDLAGALARGLGCPVGIDTDVNGAALAEARWGAGVGHGTLLYLTVGTGVGGGFVSGGRPLHGLTHPEMGHIRLPRHPDDRGFAGLCPFHGDCLEGLAAGPAIEARWGASLSRLSSDHRGLSIVAWYLAQAMVTFQAVLSPARIVLGGGVMATPGLIEAVRRETRVAGAGYFAGNPDALIVAPGLGDRSGLMGALAIALDAATP